MSKVSNIVAREEGIRIVREGNQRGLSLRLVGGVAALVHSHTEQLPESLSRDYVDLDFVGLSKETSKITKFMIEMGYQPNKRFNAILGSERLLFVSENEVDHIDVIMDQFRMCHKWDLRQRLTQDDLTIPLADLLLSKLQIVMITEKDIKDVFILLLDHELGDSDHEEFNSSYLAGLLGGDWGLWKTVTNNLGKCLEFAKEQNFHHTEIIIERLNAITNVAENAPKSPTWKLRAIVGERVKWYELPEDVKH